MKTTENKQKKRERRLGLRVDTDVFYRLEDVMPRLKREARERGEKVSQQAVVEEAINFYLNFLQRKGDGLLIDVKEIIALGSDRTQRMLLSCIAELKQKARAEAARQAPKTAG